MLERSPGGGVGQGANGKYEINSDNTEEEAVEEALENRLGK